MQVYLVDDERDLLASLAITLKRAGYETQSFNNPQAFLSVALDLTIGCVLLDYNMPGLNGLQVQEQLRTMKAGHAVVLLTGVGEVPEAVAAMREGAVDFLRKPFRSADLLAALERAESVVEAELAARERAAEFGALKPLTPREREILESLAKGLQNKQVAYDLGISVRTVEMHRTRLMKKLNAQTIGGAVAFAKEAGLL